MTRRHGLARAEEAGRALATNEARLSVIETFAPVWTGAWSREAVVADGRLTVLVRNAYFSRMKTTISEKGQITIPKRLRDRLGLRPGTVLDFEESGGRLVGRKLVPADHLDELIGILVLPGGVDGFVRETRGPGREEPG